VTTRVACMPAGKPVNMPDLADLRRVHVVVIQPAGHVHSLGLLDPALYLRHQLGRLGIEVSLGKNRLREDAVNVVLGAHLGFAPRLRERHACVFLNLEQIGSGGAALPPGYVELLKTSPTADCDPENVSGYASDPGLVPVLPFLHAPYLCAQEPAPLCDRPIELLFFGSLNERRARLIERVRACGRNVHVLAAPLFGPERDHLVRQARAVLNCHFYEAARFESIRAHVCLSLGTPLVSEPAGSGGVLPPFQEAVEWFDDSNLEAFFTARFGTESFFADAQRRLAGWRQTDAHRAYEAFASYLAVVGRAHRSLAPAGPWRPAVVNLGSGRDYRPGWLNIDVLERAEPDLVLDFSRPLELPLSATTRLGARVVLEAGSVRRIVAGNVLEHVHDLPGLMTNALALLREGGEFDIEVPYEKAPTAWQDPTHVRAMNESSWLYYTDWFWYLGWFEHRFALDTSSWLDARLQPCGQETAHFMRARLRKVCTTPAERTVARAMRPDFGLVSD